MKRIAMMERPDAMQQLHQDGRNDYRHAHDSNNGWRESACYVFSAAEIEALNTATETMQTMVMQATAHVIEGRQFSQFHLPESLWPVIEASWAQQEPALYGRFDFGLNAEGQIKLFEYNADTPASFLETGILQQRWRERVAPEKRQYNALYPALIDSWRRLKIEGVLDMVGFLDHAETVDCLTAMQGLSAQANVAPGEILDVRNITEDGGALFVTSTGRRIENLYKFFDWEEVIVPLRMYEKLSRGGTRILEPAWKIIPANKMILHVLWRLFPNHPYLLETALEPNPAKKMVQKPLAGRVGEGIRILQNHHVLAQVESRYKIPQFLYQEYFAMPRFQGQHFTIGSWMVQGKACGIGVREDLSPIINTHTSYFVPHYYE